MVCLNKVIVKQLFSPTLTFQDTAKSQTLVPRIYCAMAGNFGIHLLVDVSVFPMLLDENYGSEVSIEIYGIE